MTINHLGYLGANEIAALIRQRKLSPVEVITDILEWIERVEPRINAFAHFAPEEALRSARRAEELILRGDPLPPLLGVPVTIKDHVDVRGMPTRSGSTLTKAMAAAHDNPLVTRLKNAGAIVLGKTTTSEFGWKAVSQSPLHGITHNPWKHGFNAGASSAGAAAAAAAGCGPLHLGSDGAGSVRLPAHFCGLYGLKLTYGRIPLVPQMKGDHVVHFGPLTRNVEDAALMMDALSGPHHLDPMSLPSSGESYSRDIRRQPGSLRIACSEDLGHARVDPEVRALVANAIRRIAGLPGVILSSVTPEWGIEYLSFAQHRPLAGLRLLDLDDHLDAIENFPSGLDNLTAGPGVNLVGRADTGASIGFDQNGMAMAHKLLNALGGRRHANHVVFHFPDCSDKHWIFLYARELAVASVHSPDDDGRRQRRPDQAI